jgi:DNA-directed RNA polymerase subunit beta'
MAGIQAVQFEENGRQKQMNSIYMMARSGARGSTRQMKQLAGMRGLMAKPDGSIIETPIISNFKEGLSVNEYFNSTHGARKGLADTALKTANSGYLTRRLVDVAQDCIITKEDCGTERGLTMSPIVDAGQIVASIGQRILGRTALEDIVHPATGEVIVPAGTMVEEKDVDVIEEAGIQTVKIRSALTCELQSGVCGVCYGRDLARGTPVNMGEAVGVIAAQSIGEPGTQLTMRTFHMGGTAQVVDQSFLEASYEGTIEIRNRNIVRNSDGVLIAMGRNMAIIIRDEKGEERATQRVTYGSKIMVDDGDKVKRGQRLAEWDPYTRPIMTEVEGTAQFEDLVDGLSVQESADEATGITKRMVIDWRSTPRGSDLKPAIMVMGKDGKVAKLAKGGDARFMLSVDAILSVEPGSHVKPGDVIARVPMESAKTKDITGGLPRVAELFEARRPKDHAVIAEIDGTIRYGRDYKNKRRIIIEPHDETQEPAEYLIPKGRPFHLQDGDTIEKGDYVLDGNPAPHDILSVKGVEALASYLVNEIQEVYRLQGVVINDKHIEVIVRQMLQKVEITNAGDSQYIAGDNVDRIELEEVNERLIEEGKEPATGDPVLLGITKASLQTPSFISAASFQETTKVLTEAAVAGKIDTLQGLKENVIVGRLIPAGTGGTMNQIRRIATARDDLILDERRKTSNAASADAMLVDMTASGEAAE